ATKFDDSSALPVWLKSAGYTNALIGKYMNRNDLLAPGIAMGWDEWQTFVENGGEGVQVYYDYTLNENGTLVHYDDTPGPYSPDVLRDRTLAFIRGHADQPFFLVYAPFAPHAEAVPAPRHAGRFKTIAPWRPPNWAEQDISLKPDWVGFMSLIT